MKAARIIFVIILAVTTSVVSIDYLLKERFMKSVDAPEGTVTIQGIKDRVTIRRDRLGIPFIEAQNEDDLFFAAGYATAADRLWQMSILKLVMRGRLSEYLGKDYFKIDLFMRSLGAAELIGDTMKRLDAGSMRVLENYARGVNAYTAGRTDLPAEFFLTGTRPEPWKPEDSLYVFAMLGLNLSFNFIEELDFINMAGRVGYERAAFLVPVYPDEPLPFDEAKKLSEIDPKSLNRLAAGWSGLRDDVRKMISISMPASNNWAVAGSRTKSGKSIICNDTHLELMMPNTWIILHLKCPGYEAAGVTPPGLPIVGLGYNGRLAWGATMVMADNQDIFVEKLKTINGAVHYLYRGEWLPARVRKETFIIRGGTTVTRNILHTVHGPLLNQALELLPVPPELPIQPMPVKTDYGLALSWGMGDGSKTMKGFMNLGKSKTVDEMRRAVMDLESIFLNVVFGDADNIAWQVSGKFPLRRRGTGQLPSPGWTGEYDWVGYLPAGASPSSTNPPEGYIATANNRTVPRGYPHQLTSSWYNPERAERLHEVLGSIAGATAEDMIRLQFDHRSLLAKKVQDMLFRGESSVKIGNVIRSWKEPRASRAREALDFLNPKKFNAVMDRESPSAAVLGAFVHASVRLTFLDELGPEEGIVWESFQDSSLMSYSAQQDHLLGREDSPFWDNVKTPARETKWDIIAGALDSAILLCEERMGSNRGAWKWGRIHTYLWSHDFTKKSPFFRGYFNRGPFPASGDSHTLDVTEFSWGDNFDVVVIPAMRLVVDFGLPEPVRLMGTHGQSGNPSSPHYDDMLDYYLNGKNHPLPFGKAAVEKQYRDILVLEPAVK